MKIGKLTARLDYHFLDRRGQAITDPDRIRALLGREVTDIVNNTGHITKGCLFFCIKGDKFNGHSFALQALETGAAALVVQEDLDLSAWEGEEPIVIRVHDTRYAMAFISAAWFGDPASRMKIIGVTGTKGKTTTTYMIRSILQNAGFNTGLIGTIEVLYNDVRMPAGNTTPESLLLQKIFRDMADAGVEVVVMEVSSQALKLHRTQGFVFDIGIFTNLSEDHIGPGEHTDFSDYLRCKSLLFRQCRTGIVNIDDPYCGQILENATCQVLTYGMDPSADFSASDRQLIRVPGELGVTFDISGRVKLHAQVPMPGTFTLYNALCAVSVCSCFGADPLVTAAALSKVFVRGRIEMVRVSDDFTLMIDYAHNAMALRSLLESLREYEPGRLVCLFGCGGNRDRERRFQMGEVSGKLADFTIITSDNPRDEDPMAIIADIRTGMERTSGKYVEIPDRKEAIAYAIHHGQPGDIIVLAGKGHEDYQIIKGVKYPMDERDLIQEILEEDRHKQSPS